jgi:hypothetical protein
VAIPCGSLWIYILGWSLAGMGAQTEMKDRAVGLNQSVRNWLFNEALRFEGYAQGPFLHPEKTIEREPLRLPFRRGRNMS